MPKRSCPWPESAPPQRKTRVTERAACGEAGRSAVFDSTAPRCALCLRTQLSGASCARCERAVCGQCQQRCSLCQQDHCFTCCLPSYEGHDETLVCADCAPR